MARLSSNFEFPRRRTLRARQADSPGGCLSSVQHCWRKCAPRRGRVSSFSKHRLRLCQRNALPARPLPSAWHVAAGAMRATHRALYRIDPEAAGADKRLEPWAL